MIMNISPMISLLQIPEGSSIFLVLQPFIVLKPFVLHVVLLLHGLNLQNLNLNQIYWHFQTKLILQWIHALTIYVLIKHVDYLGILLLNINRIPGHKQPDS